MPVVMCSNEPGLMGICGFHGHVRSQYPFKPSALYEQFPRAFRPVRRPFFPVVSSDRVFEQWDLPRMMPPILSGDGNPMSRV